jgi:chorismate lyase/3-hydroxybenzoate synthase
MLLEHSSQLQIMRPGQLSVHSEADPDRFTLMCFTMLHELESGWSTGLEFLGGDLYSEFWQTNMAPSFGQHGNVIWRRSGGLMFLAYEQPDDGHQDIATIANNSYARMLELATREGCNWPVRAWNYIPLINAGSGDAERYRKFCIGRAKALVSAGISDSLLCAGTAIGGDDNILRIFMLCSDTAAVNIENPRQISAYHYPRAYGPRGPSFARATAVHSDGDRPLLMISGTSSVVGHASRHAGDVAAQLEETIFNLNTLLAASADQLGVAETSHDFDQHSLLRVYVRHARDWPLIQARLLQQWPQVRLAGLRGDICRADLLVEVEAVTQMDRCYQQRSTAPR